MKVDFFVGCDRSSLDESVLACGFQHLRVDPFETRGKNKTFADVGCDRDLMASGSSRTGVEFFCAGLNQFDDRFEVPVV